MNYFGVGGEFLHDAGFTKLDHSGNIIFASQSERFTGIKHDAFIPQKLWKKYYDSNDCFLVSNNDWEGRIKFRPGSLDKFKKKYPHLFLYDSPDSVKHPSVYQNKSPTHHLSHCVAALATRPKSFDLDDCVLVSADGNGEYQSAAIYDHKLQLKKQVTLPKSIGFLWSMFTEEIGLRPNGDEYVTMGLSSYGNPSLGKEALEMFNLIPEWDIEKDFVDVPYEEKYYIKDSYLYNIVTYLLKNSESKADAAASLQFMTNQYLLDLMKEARKYGSKLCYSGGVAQNIVSNTFIADLFDDVWIDVNPGDGGASLGAAAWAFMQDTGQDRINWSHPFHGYNIDNKINPEQIIDYLLKNKVCGIANGPAEFSYRAYGNRSLIADVRYDVKDTVNNIKRRQKYRPFAPAILEEKAHEYFEGRMNKWMQFTAKAKHDFSSVTHVDGTGRVQLVPKDSKSILRQVLECYHDKTGIPMLLNTSLNVRGRPMVNNEEDAKLFTYMYDVKIF